MGSEGRPLVVGELVSGAPLGRVSSSEACKPAQALISMCAQLCWSMQTCTSTHQDLQLAGG